MERQNILYRLKQGLSLAGILVSILGFVHASQAAQTYDDKPLPLPTSSSHAPETTAEPTVDPSTPTPVLTLAPTATSVFDFDILVNGDFETLDGTPLLDPWKTKGHQNNRIVCNSPGEIVTTLGQCIFRFEGNTRKSSTLEQTIDLTNLDIKKNDYLRFSLYARVDSAESTGQAKLIVKYKDRPTDKAVIELYDETGDGRNRWYRELVVQSDQVKAIQVVISHNRKAPTVYIDDVSLNKLRYQ
jgi:hypothetical protein